MFDNFIGNEQNKNAKMLVLDYYLTRHGMAYSLSYSLSIDFQP